MYVCLLTSGAGLLHCCPLTSFLVSSRLAGHLKPFRLQFLWSSVLYWLYRLVVLSLVVLSWVALSLVLLSLGVFPLVCGFFGLLSLPSLTLPSHTLPSLALPEIHALSHTALSLTLMRMRLYSQCYTHDRIFK